MLRVDRSERAALLCPFCRDTLEQREGTDCGGCSTRYHAACAEELASCAVLGCEGEIPLPSPSIRVQPRRAGAASPLRDLAMLLAGLGVPGVALFLVLSYPERAGDILSGAMLICLVLCKAVSAGLRVESSTRHPRRD